MSRIPFDAIKIEGRHRKDLGNVESLADSIREVGLLHPVVLTADNRLIAGQRRIEACKRLGWTDIPYRVAESVVDAKTFLMAERDENDCREEMRPSEKVALGKALEELERPKAAARRAEGATVRDGRPSENFTEGPLGSTADIVGAAVGMSRPTYERAKLVVEAAEDESLPEDIRAQAIAAKEEMDRTGKVTPAHDKVAPLIGKKPARGGTERNGKGRRKDRAAPYEPVTERQKGLAAGQKRRLESALSGISGFCRGLEDVDVGMAIAACTPEEVATWATVARNCIRALNSIKRTLDEA